MTLYQVDPATGKWYGHIRWPDGQQRPVAGCRWCGFRQDGHSRRWVASRRWHHWTPPTNDQILARMAANRNPEAKE